MGRSLKSRDSWKRWWPIPLACLLVGVFVLNHFIFPPDLAPYHEQREMMDTWVSITVFDFDESHAQAALQAAFTRMEAVVAIASAFDPSAEVARLNATGRLDSPSPELIDIIEQALAIFDVSQGTFDITIKPLLDLWLYDPASEKQFWELSPAEQEQAIAETMSVIGADHLVLQSAPPSKIELAPGMKITLGGIAKGYAVDQGLQILIEHGIEHALIDAGGDIAVAGGKPGGQPWEIALRDPENNENVLAEFELIDGAIATSGNYLRFFDPEAQVGHIMDPRTGYSAHLSSSATVIALTCTEADALATAVFVLGPTTGIEIIDQLEGVEAMVLAFEDPLSVVRSRGLGHFEIQKKDGV
ncbi:FAD:protein FMN transferase [Candidatus Bipolaricaulota bacterium]|nr:FAD:protein FMN transferase [Candidatus Bipolaricaulota bacterium]